MADTEHKNKKVPPSTADELRAHAEEILDGRAPTPLETEDFEATLHELRVHQIELEMQNAELRRAQLELEDSRAQYVDLFDSAPVGYLILGGTGIIGNANLTAAHLLNLERRLLLGQPFSLFVFGEDRDAFYLYNRALLETGEAQTFELRLQGFSSQWGEDADLSHFWALVEARPQRSDDGEVLSSLVAFTDITERKRAEEALAMKNAVFDSSIAAVSIADRRGAIIEANDAFLHVWGYPGSDEVIGKPIEHFLSDKSEATEIIKALDEYGRWQGQYVAKRKDGSTFIAEALATVLLNESGEVSGYQSAVTDITDRKRSEGATSARIRITAYAANHSLNELIQQVIDEVERLTGSTIGFFHFVDEDQESLLLQAWSTNTIATLCTAEGQGSHYAVSAAGVWADCVRQARPLIHNDYASLPDKKGLPAGHAAVVRELTVPLLRGVRIWAVLGVGNKPVDYDALDLESAQLLGDLTLDLVLAKRAEEALEQSEERFRTLFEDLPAGVSALSADGALVLANPALEELMGLTLEEMQSGAYRSRHYIHADGTRMLPEEFASTIAARERRPVHDVETGIVKADGSVTWVSVSAFPIVSGPLDTVVVTSDITERKHAVDDLRESQASLAAILQATADGILAVDADGATLFANERFAELWTIPPEVMETKDEAALLQYVLDQLADPTGFLAKVQELYGSDQESFDELQFKDGRAFERVSLLLRDGDELRGRVWSFRDVSERKRAEEALRLLNATLETRVTERTEELSQRARELEIAMNAKDTFLASMSHELRTPLNSIIGFSSIMESGMAGELPPEAHKQMGFVLDSGRQMLDLVNTLLDSASIAAGTLKLHIAPFQLSELLDTVRSTMGPLAQAKHLELRIGVRAEPVTVVSDQGRIREVVFNLVGNAIKFTEQGSISVDVTAVDGLVRFVVTDTGVGIAPEDLSKIMEPFYQLPQPGIAKTQGAGLGLGICTKIAEALGGELTVESEIGVGSTFTLCIPMLAERG